jgi:hypothetical protein
MIIATIRLPGGDVVLDSEKGWIGPAAVRDFLNGHYVSADRSSSAGDWHRTHARQMAGILGAEVEITPAEEQAALHYLADLEAKAGKKRDDEAS